MKKIPFLFLAALAPIFLISPLAAQDPFAAPAAEKKIEKKKPVLSFYYFDG